ncbi:Cytochrome c-type TorC [Gossypium arboreum]|uniref:Cytochrome c-type TorC n=1 Tax=Gossypium arboreum TaxID=29729 RepID=A0A0B0NWC2_GOSAR|nr:Cytochrome c-type TorC [Gossypium arboreum]
MTLGDMCASVRHVWDMHQPHYESQCKTCLGHASASRYTSQFNTWLGHASALRRELVVRPVWDMASTLIDESQCKTCLGHGISLEI